MSIRTIDLPMAMTAALLLFLAMALPCGAVNDFLTDPNCVMWLTWEAADIIPTFVEVDAGNDITRVGSPSFGLTMTDYTSGFQNTWIYRDFGVNFFGGDFSHKFRLTYTNVETSQQTVPWMLSNVVDDLQGQTAPHVYLNWISTAGGVDTMTLGSVTASGTNTDVTANDAVAISTEYFITVVRDDDGGAGTGLLTCYICTTAHYGEVGSSTVDTLSVQCDDLADYRYMYMTTGYVDNTFNGTWGTVGYYYLDGILAPSIDTLVDNMGLNYPRIDSADCDVNTVDYKEGVQAGEFIGSGVTRDLRLEDAGLTSDFPGVSGGDELSFSFCFWFNWDNELDQNILGKAGHATSNLNSWFITMDSTLGVETLNYYIGYNSGDDDELLVTSEALATGRWYHIACTYNGSTKAWVMRVWDDTAGALHTTSSGTATNTMSPDAGFFHAGGRDTSAGQLNGTMDELLVFNDVLTTDEIDEIRSGTYGAAASGQVMPLMFTGD